MWPVRERTILGTYRWYAGARVQSQIAVEFNWIGLTEPVLRLHYRTPYIDKLMLPDALSVNLRTSVRDTLVSELTCRWVAIGSIAKSYALPGETEPVETGADQV